MNEGGGKTKQGILDLKGIVFRKGKKWKIFDERKKLQAIKIYSCDILVRIPFKC